MPGFLDTFLDEIYEPTQLMWVAAVDGHIITMMM
jgi:hypothetical protein